MSYETTVTVNARQGRRNLQGNVRMKLFGYLLIGACALVFGLILIFDRGYQVGRDVAKREAATSARR